MHQKRHRERERERENVSFAFAPTSLPLYKYDDVSFVLSPHHFVIERPDQTRPDLKWKGWGENEINLVGAEVAFFAGDDILL